MSAAAFKYDYKTRQFERRVLLLVTLMQFINIWDFMLVMPLGPDFARALGINIANLGLVVGSYSLSAAIVGIASARYIDRFDRRSVILLCLAGMVISTLAMTLATSFTHLIALRIITGAFGGPVMACSLAIIADVFPDARRGEAVGKVFASFALAAVLGVPMSLEIAQYFGWQAPFIAVSIVAAITMGIVRIHLPPMRSHLTHKHAGVSAFSVINGLRTVPAIRYACVLMVTGTFAAFLIIPNISAHVQQNMNYPRQWLGFLYFCGGISAFFSMRLAGRRADLSGYANTCLLATCLAGLCVWLWFYEQLDLPQPMYFVFFMMAMSTRNVTSNALLTKIPSQHQRAGFMSLMSAIQHLMSGVGAMCSTFLLSQSADEHLQGTQALALLGIAAFTIMPWMMFRIEACLRARKVPVAA